MDHFDATYYVTRVGDHKTVTLADESQVQLNTATRLRASVTDTERVVWLDAGEAYFEVAHQAGRPFVVYAEDRRVTVLGTKFSVRRMGADVKVTVLEGKVRVDRPTGTTIPKLVVLNPGEELLAHGDSTVVVPANLERVTAELTWRFGLLTFDGASLGDVVAEFNRYSRHKLEADARASAIRIGGVFDASNVEGFVRLLHEAYGLKIEQSGDEIKISQ
jgi:transmembrane sensor